jgi:hypothetical protein
VGVHAFLRYRILITAKKTGLAGEPRSDEPKDHNQQIDPDLGVHLCLHALGDFARVIRDAGEL